MTKSMKCILVWSLNKISQTLKLKMFTMFVKQSWEKSLIFWMTIKIVYYCWTTLFLTEANEQIQYTYIQINAYTHIVLKWTLANFIYLSQVRNSIPCFFAVLYCLCRRIYFFEFLLANSRYWFCEDFVNVNAFFRFQSLKQHLVPVIVDHLTHKFSSSWSK